MTLSDFLLTVPTVLPARRGNLYEQYYERVGADGKRRRNGPYYVWTRCEGGKMISSRITREDVPRVREEIARGQQLEVLLAQLWRLAEDLARDGGDIKKKSLNNSTGRRPLSLPRP